MCPSLSSGQMMMTSSGRSNAAGFFWYSGSISVIYAVLPLTERCWQAAHVSVIVVWPDDDDVVGQIECCGILLVQRQHLGNIRRASTYRAMLAGRACVRHCRLAR